jgi:hypothetical protein
VQQWELGVEFEWSDPPPPCICIVSFLYL